MIRTRRGLADTLIAGATLLLLLATLVSIGERMRQAAAAVQGAPGAALKSALIEARRSVAGIDAARDGSVEHAPLTIFAAAGAALFLFMVRT